MTKVRIGAFNVQNLFARFRLKGGGGRQGIITASTDFQSKQAGLNVLYYRRLSRSVCELEARESKRAGQKDPVKSFNTGTEDSIDIPDLFLNLS